MAEMTQEQMLEQQKANCPFCKMVKGEIPTKKVYEDDQMLAILDINPANKGHVLVLPKEHYPILPLIPPPIFKHMFVTTKKLMAAMRKGLIVPKVTMFLANGGAAGQMSPHFLYHLIPRENGDGLDKLEVEKRETSQKEIEQSLAQNMQAIMRNHLAREMQAGSPVAKLAMAQETKAQTLPSESPVSAPSITKEEAKEQLSTLLQQNPQLKQLIIQNPDMVTEYTKKSPELSILFEGVDIHALSKKLNAAEEKPSAVSKPEPEVEEKTETSTPQKLDNPIDDVPDAETLTDDELMVYLEQKPRLKEMLIHDLDGLVELSKSNPRVGAFFQHTTPHALAERVLTITAKHDEKETSQHEQEHIEEVDAKEESEGVDFDALSKMLEENK